MGEIGETGDIHTSYIIGERTSHSYAEEDDELDDTGEETSSSTRARGEDIQDGVWHFSSFTSSFSLSVSVWSLSSISWILMENVDVLMGSNVCDVSLTSVHLMEEVDSLHCMVDG